MVQRSLPVLRSYAALIVLVLATLATLFAYRVASNSNGRRVETEFFRRVDNRHALTREVLNYYEAGLFALRNLFLTDDLPTREEFDRVAQEIITRYPGISGFEWAPLITHAERADFERALSAELGRPVRITHRAGSPQLVPSPEQAEYAPVRFIFPAEKKGEVFGFDFTTSAIGESLDRTRAERTLIVSPVVKLIETPYRSRTGVVFAWPVFRGTGPTAPMIGYVLGVFRVTEMLDKAVPRNPGPVLDALYIDSSETDPAQRVFYYQPAVAAEAQAPWPTEAEFRASSLLREESIPIGKKTWRVLYRPNPAWLHEVERHLPEWLLAIGLLCSATLSGWIFQLTRRATVVERVVTERTAELTESQRKLDRFVQALPGMAYRGAFGTEFELTYISEGAIALTGYQPEEFIRGDVHVHDIVHPEDLAAARQAMLAALASGGELELEHRIRRRDGTEKWVLSRGQSSGVDEQGRHQFEGLSIDITAQKLAERERLGLERKLHEGQKLESLGLLAGGVAHDFNNLLTGILGNANLTRLLLPPDAKVLPNLQAIETASLRAAELCRQMLAYAGKGRFVVEPLDLSALAEGLVPLLEVSIARKAALRLALNRELPAVLADATQLRQIVMNFVLNAADATSGPTGLITITTGVVRADATLLARCAAGADCPPGDYVFLEVRDNGSGMTPEVRAKIFDPFFTTKFAGRGLGLAAALGIVRGHHGALQVESTPGEGSTFRLLLPSTTGSRPAGPSSPAPTDWHHTGHALVIDDEEPVRHVAAQLLTGFGLTVRTAADGAAGLALFGENPAQIDVVLLDLVMPGMNGEQTLQALRAIQPEVRVLLVSGFTEGELLRQFGPESGRLAFLPKPFTREALANRLRELLG